MERISFNIRKLAEAWPLEVSKLWRILGAYEVALEKPSISKVGTEWYSGLRAGRTGPSSATAWCLCESPRYRMDRLLPARLPAGGSCPQSTFLHLMQCASHMAY